jgi:hypothetical protein
MDGRQRTWASLTGAGRKAFAAHMAALQALVAHARRRLRQNSAQPAEIISLSYL